MGVEFLRKVFHFSNQFKMVHPMVFTSFLSDEISVLNILVLSDEDVEDAMDLTLLGFSVGLLFLLLALVVEQMLDYGWI